MEMKILGIGKLCTRGKFKIAQNGTRGKFKVAQNGTRGNFPRENVSSRFDLSET